MKTRHVLASIAVGGLIGASLLWLGMARAHADQDSDARMVCKVIAANPNNHGVDGAVLILIADGYGIQNHEVTNELLYALTTYCPQYESLVLSWAHTPTVNGQTPEGSMA